MKLRILGSGTAIPHRERGASGYACVADDGSALLLECGPGSTRRWPEAGLSFETVRAIAVTHHHVDHCGDLAAVMFGRNVPEPPVDTPLLLAGPVGQRELVDRLEGAFGAPVTDRSGARMIAELGDGDVLQWGSFHLESAVVRHTAGALGFRVRCDGRTLAFSGDSGPCEALAAVCRGSDLALMECSYPEERDSSSHLNAASAARMAVDARVQRLVLTHFYPECDGVDLRAQVRRGGYEGDLHLARDGDVFEV